MLSEFNNTRHRAGNALLDASGTIRCVKLAILSMQKNAEDLCANNEALATQAGYLETIIKPYVEVLGHMTLLIEDLERNAAAVEEHIAAREQNLAIFAQLEQEQSSHLARRNKERRRLEKAQSKRQQKLTCLREDIRRTAEEATKEENVARQIANERSIKQEEYDTNMRAHAERQKLVEELQDLSSSTQEAKKVRDAEKRFYLERYCARIVEVAQQVGLQIQPRLDEDPKSYESYLVLVEDEAYAQLHALGTKLMDHTEQERELSAELAGLRQELFNLNFKKKQTEEDCCILERTLEEANEGLRRLEVRTAETDLAILSEKAALEAWALRLNEAEKDREQLLQQLRAQESKRTELQALSSDIDDQLKALVIESGAAEERRAQAETALRALDEEAEQSSEQWRQQISEEKAKDEALDVVLELCSAIAEEERLEKDIESMCGRLEQAQIDLSALEPRYQQFLAKEEELAREATAIRQQTANIRQLLGRCDLTWDELLDNEVSKTLALEVAEVSGEGSRVKQLESHFKQLKDVGRFEARRKQLEEEHSAVIAEIEERFKQNCDTIDEQYRIAMQSRAMKENNRPIVEPSSEKVAIGRRRRSPSPFLDDPCTPQPDRGNDTSDLCVMDRKVGNGSSSRKRLLTTVSLPKRRNVVLKRALSTAGDELFESCL